MFASIAPKSPTAKHVLHEKNSHKSTGNLTPMDPKCLLCWSVLKPSWLYAILFVVQCRKTQNMTGRSQTSCYFDGCFYGDLHKRCLKRVWGRESSEPGMRVEPVGWQGLGHVQGWLIPAGLAAKLVRKWVGLHHAHALCARRQKFLIIVWPKKVDFTAEIRVKKRNLPILSRVS